jgi:integrase/recombinase XerD
MNKRYSYGIYTELIEQYVAYKQTLGFKMKDVVVRLNVLHRLRSLPEDTSQGVPKEVFDEWSLPQAEESDNNRYGRIHLLRQFSYYLQIIGYNSYTPKLPPRKCKFIPHIFTNDEINRIFEASNKLMLKSNNKLAQVWVMPTLLRMLYSTGIRIGEALNLKHRDVNLGKGFLMLRNCKNGQDRMVPMSATLVEVCKDHFLFKQTQLMDTDSDAYFFTALGGSQCQRCTIYEHFRTIMYKAGIPYRGRKEGPRMHDLRHTFCVKSLLKMSEAGIDLYCSMPVLSTYMGHQHIKATNGYVRLTNEMFPGILHKIDAAYRHVFPETITE